MAELWWGVLVPALGVTVGAAVLWTRFRKRRELHADSAEGQDCVLLPRAEPETREPASGMGWPFRRKGHEGLRIRPVDGAFHVTWRVGDEVVARLVCTDEGAARGLYAWLGERFGSGALRLADRAEAAGTEQVLLEHAGGADGSRRLVLQARGGHGHRVVETIGGEVRSTAWVIDAAEGQELFGFLVDPRFAPRSAEANPVERPERSVDAALAAVFD